jgi:ABC-type nickel/cobalt efflux system permease component RcnA
MRRPAPGAVVIEHDHEHGNDREHEHALDEVLAHEHVHERTPAPVAAVGGAGFSATGDGHHHRHRHRHVVVMPDDPFFDYNARTAVGVGVIHGIGAETPTQLLVFIAAAGAGGTAVGIVMLLAFVVGLVVSNTGIALAASFGYLGASKSFPVYAAVSIVTGVFSLVLGGLFLLGQGGVLPAFFSS